MQDSMGNAMLQVRAAQRARLASLAPPPVFGAAAGDDEEHQLAPFFDDDDAGTDFSWFTERQEEGSDEDEGADDGPSYVAPVLSPREFAVPNTAVVDSLVDRGFSSNCAKRAALATGNVGDVDDWLVDALDWANDHKDQARANEPLQWTLDVAAGWLSHPLSADSVLAASDPGEASKEVLPDLEELPDLTQQLSRLLSGSPAQGGSASSSPARSYTSSSSDSTYGDEQEGARRVYCSPHDEVVELDSSDDEDEEDKPGFGSRASSGRRQSGDVIQQEMKDAARNRRVNKCLDFDDESSFDPNSSSSTTAAAAAAAAAPQYDRERSRSPRGMQQHEASFGFGYYCADGAAPEAGVQVGVQG